MLQDKYVPVCMHIEGRSESHQTAGKIDRYNMKLLNYVRVKSDCVIVGSNMHV